MDSEKVQRNIIIKEDQLKELIEHSKENILSLNDDWDGYGAEPIESETLDRAFELLRRILKSLWDEEIFDVPLPRIQPVPDSSIDLNWMTEDFELLVNIPANGDQIVCIYGEHVGHPEDLIEHRGNYNLVDITLIKWLMSIL